jgi:hypothetical protein
MDDSSKAMSFKYMILSDSSFYKASKKFFREKLVTGLSPICKTLSDNTCAVNKEESEISPF